MTTKHQQGAAVTPFADDADAAENAAVKNQAADRNPQHAAKDIFQQDANSAAGTENDKIVATVRSLCAAAMASDAAHAAGDTLAREQQFKRDGYGSYGALFRSMDAAGESTEAWSDFTALVADTVKRGRFSAAAGMIRVAARDLTPSPTMASQLDIIMRDAEAADIAREAIQRAQNGSLQDARRMMAAARRTASAGYAVKLEEISRDIEVWQSRKNTFRKNSKIMWAAVLAPLALMTLTAIPSTIAFIKDPPTISLPDPQILARGVQPIRNGAVALGKDLLDSKTRIETMLAQKSADQNKFDGCVIAYAAFASAATNNALITPKSEMSAIEAILSGACQSFSDRIEEIAAAAGRMTASQRAAAVDEILQRVRGGGDAANIPANASPTRPAIAADQDENDTTAGDTTAGDTTGAMRGGGAGVEDGVEDGVGGMSVGVSVGGGARR